MHDDVSVCSSLALLFAMSELQGFLDPPTFVHTEGSIVRDIARMAVLDIRSFIFYIQIE